ncbi:putative ribonuclease H-like domain-containing protein, partial [Tanacetum coccineum]
KQEKESNQLKIENFDNASKGLDKLIGSHITDKSRKGVGFVSYTVVPPPHTGLFSPLNLDLSYSGLEEFQQPEFEGYGPKTSKSVSEDISNEVRKFLDAPLVEELVSDDKLTAITIKGKAWPKVVNTARPNSTVVNAVRANQVNAVKGSACWVWRPTKLNSASITLKRHNYVDGRGKSKILMEDMLPLEEEPKEGKLLVNELLKLNSVLFTDTGCFVLSPDSKLADESQIYLVKIIKCDNGTEFKNRVMSEFCEKKGIKKEFSIARTPQQNGVAERRNRTLIEAARTMLADSKLPTTFWAEAVNTACYVQNRVLVVKPHNKTPYELFRGRTPALSFMRPFGCHVTILNTLDYLGKFDGKSDEGFFVGYSMNSKAFRVYNIRTRKVEENLHIRFLEDKPIIAGDGPKWLFDIDVLTKSMNYVPVVAGTNSNDFMFTILIHLPKNASNDEPQPSSDAGKKDDEGVNKESGIDDQERPKNSTQDINTAGPSINTASTNVNTGSLNINTVSPTVTTAPLEATHADFFGDETEIDMSNITTTYLVPSTPNTRIYKDHSLDHVIGDVQSGVQTRRMTKTTNEQGFISAVYEGKTHKDLHTCLFACFLSQEEPKKVIQALKDLSWIEAMQEELLQFKLQQVWTLVDLPHGKRAIGTKWVYRNKKDERGLKRKFYVCQPLGFKDPEFPDRVYKVEKALYGLHQAPRACQDKYVDEILKKFGFSTVKTASTPMETSKPLMKDENAEDIDVHLYRSMIGSLMYLTSSRPDIMFVVCACVRFQVTPKVSHFHVVKRIFRYFKGQKTGESSELAEESRVKDADELRFTTEGPRKILEIIRSRKIITEVELKRLFEPDTDDELRKLQKHIHDLTWRLYDSCGVHHVSTDKRIDIYMLVEKEYPLSRGTLTFMLVAKLLVDQDNEMSKELLRKIFMKVERPREKLYWKNPLREQGLIQET